MEFDLTIISGGARGIGLEVSRGLAEAGANVRRVLKRLEGYGLTEQ